MKVTAILFALLLAGCQSLGGYQGMSAEQITAAAKDNKAVYQCADIPSIGGGTAKLRSMIVDTGVVRYGSFAAKTCDDISFTNENKAPMKAAP